MTIKLSILAAFTVLLFSCNKNNVQEISQNKQEKIISELGFNPGTVIQGQNSAKAISFKSIGDAKKYIDAFKGREYKGNIKKKPNRIVARELYSIVGNQATTNIAYPEKEPLEPSGFGPGVTGGSTSLNDWWLWTGYNVSFSWDNDQNGNITSINELSSGLVGFTLGVSWEQKTTDYTLSGSKVNFTVRGYQNYNLIVEGIGTVFSQPVKITGSYDIRSGAYTMKEE